MPYTQEMFNSYYKEKLLQKSHPELRLIERIKANISECKKIHIIGVCGTAMGTLAFMLRDSGFEVTGSDVSFWPPMGPLLKSKGVHILEGWSTDHIGPDTDLVVVGNACGPEHIEVVSAKEKNKPLISMPELMGEYYVGEAKESLVVAGTHGKTTTTGLLSHMLTTLGLDPTYLIGGVMQSMRDASGQIIKEGTSHRVGNGTYVAFEGDEYDTAFFDARPKFLHYRPSSAIITSVEWDHIDIYQNEEIYTTAFKHLIEVTKKHLVVSHTYPLLNKLIAEARSGSIPHSADILVYGIDDTCDLKPVLGEITSQGQVFELLVKGESNGMYTTPLYGEYNTLNSVAVLGLLLSLGIDIKTDAVRSALASFPGMKRRQEIVFINAERNIVVLDDFAHHPTAVAETLKGIRNRFPGRRIVALFEPRSNTSRRKLFEHTYPGALATADLIGIKVPPYRAEIDAGQDLLDPQVVKKETESFGKIVELAETAPELVEKIIPDLQDGDVVIVMSNGSFDGILEILRKHIG